MERTPQTPLTKSVSNKSPERPSVVSDPRYARGISPRAQQRAVVVQRRHLLRWKRRAQHCALLRARSLAAAAVAGDKPLPALLRAKLRASEDELVKERECVGHLLGKEGAACRIGPGEDTMLPGEN